MKIARLIAHCFAASPLCDLRRTSYTLTTDH